MRLEVVYLGSCSGGEGGGPSKLRLPKDGGGGLPKDVTDRRPDVGEGEGRMLRGCPAGSLVTPGAGGEGTEEGDSWLGFLLFTYSCITCFLKAAFN